ncbi:hypothetical protein E4U50_007159 [Claviceps purpurea]|nr:hypothetical protein E4U27_000482 [Claviceps purpurea]KAG6219045.1 hypothetical protein E4U50_007159 [Claviceps purpurea]KAG6274272.1 hypothetical protein E4U49_004946 [Claviceps purpurea]KAG6307287.1 hypothetical protein E4U45_005183 [Claviceps purpurea]
MTISRTPEPAMNARQIEGVHAVTRGLRRVWQWVGYPRLTTDVSEFLLRTQIAWPLGLTAACARYSVLQHPPGLVLTACSPARADQQAASALARGTGSKFGIKQGRMDGWLDGWQVQADT